MAPLLAARRQPVEYFMLQAPRPDGPSLGTYAGHPIPAMVVDLFGKRYTYAGVAPRLRDGRYDVEAVGKDEWLVEPGLVYRGTPTHRGGKTPI